MLIDTIARHRFGKGFDDGGILARSGDIEYNYLNDMLDEPYFKLPPPKSTGRELFNETFAERFTHKLSPNDALATATELTARSIAMALEFLPLHESIGSAGVPPATRNAGETPAVRESFEIIASGGGVRNGYLMERIAENIPSATIRLSDEYGIPSQSKEALAFAWFAKSFMENEIIHLPKTTGAREAVILGSLSKGRK